MSEKNFFSIWKQPRQSSRRALCACAHNVCLACLSCMSSLWMDRIYIQLHRVGLRYCGDSVPIGWLFNMPRGCFRKVGAEHMEETSLASLLNLELKSHSWATHSHSVPRDDSLNVAYKDFCCPVVCCCSCSSCFKCHPSSSLIAFSFHIASCFREMAQGLPSAPFALLSMCGYFQFLMAVDPLLK